MANYRVIHEADDLTTRLAQGKKNVQVEKVEPPACCVENIAVHAESNCNCHGAIEIIRERREKSCGDRYGANYIQQKPKRNGNRQFYPLRNQSTVRPGTAVESRRQGKRTAHKAVHGIAKVQVESHDRRVLRRKRHQEAKDKGWPNSDSSLNQSLVQTHGFIST